MALKQHNKFEVCSCSLWGVMAHLTDILQYIGSTDLTYVGIGSTPHITSLEAYTDRYNQIVPRFVREIIARDKSVSILHFDTRFDEALPFVKHYIETAFPGIEQRGEYYWCMPHLEIRLIPRRFEHEDEDWFLEVLGKHIMNRGDQLIVQEYTGTELAPMLKRAYERSDNKPLFKKSILYDITYTKDCSCGTDLSKYAPIYDSRGNFINLTLLTNEELLSLVDIVPVGTVAPFLIRKFTDCIQFHHVNYRRRTQGMSCMHPCSLYNDSSDPSLIMDILQSELKPIVRLLAKLGVFNSSQIDIFNEHMDKYKDYDMYKWLTDLTGLMNLASKTFC